jgi:hypothetical protein
MSVSFIFDDASQDEGDGSPITSVYLLTRLGPLDQAWTGYMTVVPTGTNPVGPDDFPGGIFPEGTITFAVGQRYNNIHLYRRGNTTVGPDETFRLDLAETKGGPVIASATITLLDDDDWYRATALPSSVREGTDAVFTVQRSIATESVTLTWVVTASGSSGVANAVDFGTTGRLPSGTITFAPGETRKDIVVRPVVDGRLEGDEQFSITLSGVPASAARTSSDILFTKIVDGETAVSITASQASLVEGQPRVGEPAETPFYFVVQRSSQEGQQSVDWAVTGTGARPADAADFVGGVLPSGRVTFAHDEYIKTIEVKVARDIAVEYDEGFTVTLANQSSGLVIGTRSASSAIVNDDTPATFDINAGLPSRVEGQSGQVDFQFLVARSGAITVSHTVGWRVVLPGDGSLTADDFATNSLSGTIRFAPYQSSFLISLPVKGDRTPEDSELLTIELFNPGDDPNVVIGVARATSVILDDDVTFSIHADAPSVLEGHSGLTPITLTVSRTGPATIAQSVRWEISTLYGTASTDVADFGPGGLSGVISFAPGETSRTLTVHVAGDTEWEADERFVVSLGSASPSAGIATGSVIVTVLNDEMRYAIQSTTLQRPEGHAGSTPYSFTVTRAGFLDAAGSVAWSVAGSGASPADAADFVGGTLPSGVLTFAPGETTGTITVAVAGDTQAERSDRFAVTLSPTAPGASLGNATASGIIVADDSSVSITPYNAVKAEGHPGGSTPFLFTVTRTGATDAAQSVAWSVVSATGGGRANAADFAGGVLPSGIVEFAAGEARKTITVNVAGDASRENDEGFAVRLDNPTNGLLVGQAEAQGTILRDESVMSIAATLADAPEATTPLTFTVTRSGVLDLAQIVNWSVVNYGPNRISAADFEGNAIPRGSLRFEAGETTKTITINIAGDTAAEKDETFAVKLLSASPGVILSPYWSPATIRNDDTSVGITALSASKAEGQAGTTPFTFALTRTGLLDAEQSVSWAAGRLGANAASAADFLGGAFPAGTVTFSPGEARKVITLDVLADTLAEASEAFIIRLSAPTDGLLIQGSSATGLIVNDDTASARLANDWVL